jgi:hypothetical protein
MVCLWVFGIGLAHGTLAQWVIFRTWFFSVHFPFGPHPIMWIRCCVPSLCLPTRQGCQVKIPLHSLILLGVVCPNPQEARKLASSIGIRPDCDQLQGLESAPHPPPWALSGRGVCKIELVGTKHHGKVGMTQYASQAPVSCGHIPSCCSFGI